MKEGVKMGRRVVKDGGEKREKKGGD